MEVVGLRKSFVLLLSTGLNTTLHPTGPHYWYSPAWKPRILHCTHKMKSAKYTVFKEKLLIVYSWPSSCFDPLRSLSRNFKKLQSDVHDDTVQGVSTKHDDTVQGVSTKRRAWRYSTGCINKAWRYSTGCIKKAWRYSTGCTNKAWRYSTGCTNKAWRYSTGCTNKAWRYSTGCTNKAWRYSTGCVNKELMLM